MKKSFLLLTLVVAVAVSGFAGSQNGGSHQRTSASSHNSYGQGAASHGHQGQKQAIGQNGGSRSQTMGGTQQKGSNGNMGQANQGQMNQSGYGNSNTKGNGNPNNGMNGSNASSGMAQGQNGNSQQP